MYCNPLCSHGKAPDEKGYNGLVYFIRLLTRQGSNTAYSHLQRRQNGTSQKCTWEDRGKNNFYLTGGVFELT
jgi:hypothetical protein